MDKSPPSPKAIFDRAFEITDPTEREAYLDRECAGSAELRGRVEALLQAHDQAGSFLESPALPPSATVAYQTGSAAPGIEFETVNDPLRSGERPTAEGRPPGDEPGTHIGPYRLVRKIGQGGMGSVYLAEQEHPVRRQVALKIIKPGLDSGQIVARFEAERQALAMMDHLNIAKVLDAGATESGWPYFVMELVHGVSMTSYCDDKRLLPRQRLELFVPVCLAIQHAHQKGIIHRDIKPSNVLVTLYDGKPVPKVIDFGIAKAIEQPLVDPEMATQIGTIVGTLEYMSPEQADLGVPDIDTRSDVYSLGVMLYELLTGSTPLDRSRLRNASFSEVLRLIKDEEPPRPSDRVAQLGPNLAAVAAKRGTEPARIVRLLRGDSDWIALKALEKDRRRRYDTAADFAKDVQHYLADEPVEARPPSTTYLLGKFARRHRTLLATAGGFVALLLLGIVGLTVGIFQIDRARRKSDRALESEIKAEKHTRTSLEATDAVIRSMIRNRTRLGDEEKATLREVLRHYQSLEGETGDTQEARVAAAETGGRVADFHLLMGDYAEARANYERAIQSYEKLANEFGDVVEYRAELAKMHFNLGVLLHEKTGAEAAAEYRRAIVLHQQLADEFPSSPGYRRALADDYNNLGALLDEQQQLAEAEMVYQPAIKLGEELLKQYPNEPEFQISLAASYHNLANAVRDQGRPEEALKWYDRKIILLTPLGKGDHPPARAKSCLRNAFWDRAHALGKLDRHAEAGEDWQRAIELADESDRDDLRLFQATARSEMALAKLLTGKSEQAAAGAFYQIAGLYVQAAAAPAALKTDPPLQRYLAARAIAHLERARKAGFFKDRSRVDLLKHQSLDVLRKLPDFQKLESELNGGTGK